ELRAAKGRHLVVAALVCASLGGLGCARKPTRTPGEGALAVAASTGGPQPELVVQAGVSHWVKDTKFSPDGRYLAVASVDGLLKVFDVRMGKEWRTYNGAAGPVY